VPSGLWWGWRLKCLLSVLRVLREEGGGLRVEGLRVLQATGRVSVLPGLRLGASGVQVEKVYLEVEGKCSVGPSQGRQGWGSVAALLPALQASGSAVQARGCHSPLPAPDAPLTSFPTTRTCSWPADSWSASKRPYNARAPSQCPRPRCQVPLSPPHSPAWTFDVSHLCPHLRSSRPPLLPLLPPPLCRPAPQCLTLLALETSPSRV